MDLTSEYASAEKIREALDEDLDSPPRLLPSSAVSPAFETKRDEVSEWISSQIIGRFVPTRHEVVAVSKARHGIRPVAVWDLPSRVLYRTLTERLTPFLTMPERTLNEWQKFEREPLETPSTYIVAADIASCYQLIDHELLAQELLIQTGDSTTVNYILKLLQEVSGQEYGLPQQSIASDLIAEAFLDRLERALLRKNLTVLRYNDDFRFNCNSWSEVIRAIETLSDEAGKLGLILNDSKVFTWTASKYGQHLNKLEEIRNEIAAEAELDLTKFATVEGYDGALTVISKPNPDDVEILAASRVLERWKKVAGKGKVSDRRKSEHRALLRLVPLSLAILSNAPDATGEVLDISMALLRFEQTMTPNVCRFLGSRNDEDAVLSAFDKLLRSRAYLTTWQTWWLQQPLARLSDFTAGKTGAKRSLWIRSAFDNSENLPILRAQTALTLARHGKVTVDDLVKIYDRSSPIVRPVIVAAIGHLKPSGNVKRGVTRNNKIDSWVFDWARANA